MVTVTVVTPWHNQRQYERGYWAAMRSADVEVIVVDNGSTPSLPNAWRLEENRGFSPANNIGLQLARTDAVLFLNNDVEPLRPDWINQLRAALEPGVLVGANIRYDQHGDLDGNLLPYLDGWCLAGMRDDLVDLGGWDESFEEPSYFGDNELCLRGRLEGMTLRQADVGLRHIGNGTAGPPDERIRAVTERNYLKFCEFAREALVVE